MRPMSAIGSTTPEGPLGGHRVESSQVKPGTEQTAFNWAQKQQLENDQAALRTMFAAAVRAAGGIDWLTAALDKQPSYATKIGEAINGVADRKVQFDWLAPMLDDPRASAIILGWLSERMKFEPPVKSRVVDPAADAAECRAILESLPEPQRTAFRQERAKRLGVRLEDL
jgi:hypothetical protein